MRKYQDVQSDQIFIIHVGDLVCVPGSQLPLGTAGAAEGIWGNNQQMEDVLLLSFSFSYKFT